MMQCPLCGVVPATCLTQENINANPVINARLVALGYWKCTVYNLTVKPNIIPDSIVATPDAHVADIA